jgi:hypothetical protein
MQGRRDGAVALGRARQRSRGHLFYVENNYPTVHNGFTTIKQLFIGHYSIFIGNIVNKKKKKTIYWPLLIQKKNYLLATKNTQ